MSDLGNQKEIDFSVDKENLYREESITDLRAAAIRRLVPIREDGTDDPSRASIFVGNTQLMTPEGPLPIQARLMANNLAEAFAEFPGAMQQALQEVISQIQELRQQQAAKKRNEQSRIIVPGR